jgi:hypothetical protein
MSFSINDIYRDGLSNGYGKAAAEKRFSILDRFSFSSVLDVGSGPCFLQDWLRLKDIKVHYEAVDIRPEALAHCKCPTYSAIPVSGKYDLVCLFGTVTYNIDRDELKNKLILKQLLQSAKKVCSSTLIFTVFKETLKDELRVFQQDRFIYFSKVEIRNLLLSIGISNFEILEENQLDKSEYFVVCKM